MASCTCSVRLLDRLVRDFAGREIHRTQVRLQPRSAARLLSTRAAKIQRRPHTRNLETLAAGRHAFDDAYVPFDHHLKPFEPIKPFTESVNPPSPPQADLEEPSDFEPEIEFQDGALGAVSEQASIKSASEAPEDVVDLRTGPSLVELIDRVTLPDIHSFTSSYEHGSHVAKLDIILPDRTRADRRRDRKARRLEAKKFSASSVDHNLDFEAEEVRQMLAEAQKPRERKTAKTRDVPKQAGTTSTTASKDKQKSKGSNSKDLTIKPTKKEPWQTYKDTLKEKFGDQSWTPRKRISPDALAGIRALRASQPDVYTTERLAEHFQMSPEAIRRILRSKWQPSEEEMDDRRKRWEKRGIKKWSEMAEEGVRPPKRWRELGVGKTADGQAPRWKRREFAIKTTGERWIDQPSTDVFLHAADAESENLSPDMNITRRIL